jgi:autotransporter-associated beta strand protein
VPTADAYGFAGCRLTAVLAGLLEADARRSLDRPARREPALQRRGGRSSLARIWNWRQGQLQCAALPHDNEVFGAGGLQKLGAGTLTLDQANTFVGDTTVRAGTLALMHGSHNSVITSPNLVVETGATLAPGASPGILNAASVAFTSGSTFEVELGSPTPGNGAGFHDQLNATGTVDIGANLTLKVVSFGGSTPAVGDTFLIIVRADGSGAFKDLPRDATLKVNGVTLKISYTSSDTAEPRRFYRWSER